MFNIITPHLNSNYTVYIGEILIKNVLTATSTTIHLDSPDMIKDNVLISYFFKMKLLVSIPTPLSQVRDFFLNYKYNPYRTPKIFFEGSYLLQPYILILKLDSSHMVKFVSETISTCDKNSNIREIKRIYTFYPI